MKKTLSSLLVAALLVLSSLTLFLAPRFQTVTADTVNWSQLHGANYIWAPIYDPSAGNTPAPSTSLPMMVSNGGMNFIRVNIGWNSLASDPIDFEADLLILAKEADSLGFQVYYDFNANMPSAIYAAGGSDFWNSYFTNGFRVNGTDIWDYQMTNFWQPIISLLDSHTSTFGYEIINEPGGNTLNASTLQPYNTWFANHIRALTSKYIIWGSTSWDTQPSSSEEPTSGCLPHCATDIHLYGSSEASEIASLASTAQALGDKVILGELGLCGGGADCTLSASAAQALVNEFISGCKTNDVAPTYWFWRDGSNDPNDWDSLLTSSGQPDTLLGYLANAYDIYYGSATSTTTSSTSTTRTTSLSPMLVMTIVVASLIVIIVSVISSRYRSKRVSYPDSPSKREDSSQQVTRP